MEPVRDRERSEIVLVVHVASTQQKKDCSVRTVSPAMLLGITCSRIVQRKSFGLLFGQKPDAKASGRANIRAVSQ